MAIDPAASPATPAVRTADDAAPLAATPTIRLAVKTSPSLAPKTVARNQPACWPQWTSAWGLTNSKNSPRHLDPSPEDTLQPFHTDSSTMNLRPTAE